MAGVNLNLAGDRLNYFQQGILLNLQYWQGWLAENGEESGALEQDYPGLLRAIAYGLDLAAAGWPLTFPLIEQLAPFMERRGYWEAWRELLQPALALAGRLGEQAAEVNMAVLLARLSFRQSRPADTVQYYRRAVRLARQTGDVYNLARACTNLGYSYIEWGFLHRAEILCCYALDIFDQLDNDHGRAHTKNHLGVLYTQQGRWALARQHLEQACQIWQSRHDEYGSMYGHMNLGVLFIYMEDAESALRHSEMALHYAEQVGEKLEAATITMNLGIAYRLKEQWVEAQHFTRQAEQVFQDLSHNFGLALVLDNWALIYMQQQDWEKAAWTLQAALKAWRDLDNKYGEIRVMTYYAEYELNRGQKSAAHRWLRQAEHLLREQSRTKGYTLLFQRADEIRRNLTKN